MIALGVILWLVAGFYVSGCLWRFVLDTGPIDTFDRFMAIASSVMWPVVVVALDADDLRLRQWVMPFSKPKKQETFRTVTYQKEQGYTQPPGQQRRAQAWTTIHQPYSNAVYRSTPSTPDLPIVPVGQEVIAYRAWLFQGMGIENDAVLWSVAHPVRWEGPVLTADRVPSMNSRHGIYAKSTLEGLNQEYGRQPVIGEVALSGVVVEGDNGYRAERCVIRSLTLYYKRLKHEYDVSPLELAARLEKRYHVDVTLDASEAPVVVTNGIGAPVFGGGSATQMFVNGVRVGP